MTYDKQFWENYPAETTPVNAERLNHMETQYEEAVLVSKNYTDTEISVLSREDIAGGEINSAGELVFTRESGEPFNVGRVQGDSVVEFQGYVDNAVDQVVNSSVEVQDPVVAGILGDKQSLSGGELFERVDKQGYVIPNLTGVGDETQKFVDAISYASANSLPLVIPGGEYTIGEVTVPHGMVVRGAGAYDGGTTLKPADGASWMLKFNRGSTLKDIYFYIDKECDAIVLNGARNLITNIYIRGELLGRGIVMFGTSSAPALANKLLSVQVNRLGTGIWTGDHSYDQNWTQVVASMCTGPGISINDGGHQLSNLHIWENGGHGIHFRNSNSGSRLTNSYIEKNGLYGIIGDGDDTHPVSITQCYVTKNGSGGIRKVRGVGFLISDCDITENADSGISASSTVSVMTVNNTNISHQGTWGLTQTYSISSAVADTVFIVSNCILEGPTWNPLPNPVHEKGLFSSNMINGEVYAFGTPLSDTPTKIVGVSGGDRGHVYGTPTSDTWFSGVTTGNEFHISPYLNGERQAPVISGHVNGRLGFFGSTPVAKPADVAVTVEGIHTALVTLGLIS